MSLSYRVPASPKRSFNTPAEIQLFSTGQLGTTFLISLRKTSLFSPYSIHKPPKSYVPRPTARATPYIRTTTDSECSDGN